MKKYFEYMKNQKSGNLDVWGSFYNTIVGACVAKAPNGSGRTENHDLSAIVDFFNDAASANESKVETIKSFNFSRDEHGVAIKILELFPALNEQGITDLNNFFKDAFKEDAIWAKNIVKAFIFQKIDDYGNELKYEQTCEFKAQMFIDYIDVTNDNDKSFVFKSQPEVITKIKEKGMLLVKPPAFKTLHEEVNHKPLETVITNPGILASRVLNTNVEELLNNVKDDSLYIKENIPTLTLLLRKDKSPEFYNRLMLLGKDEIINATVTAVKKESAQRNANDIQVLVNSNYLWQDVFKVLLNDTSVNFINSSSLCGTMFANLSLNSNAKDIEENLRLVGQGVFSSDENNKSKFEKFFNFTEQYLKAVLKTASKQIEESPEDVAKFITGVLNNNYCKELITLSWGEDLSNLGFAGVMLDRVGSEKVKTDIFVGRSNATMRDVLVKFFVLADEIKDKLSEDTINKLEDVRLSVVEHIWTQRTATIGDTKYVYECKSPSMYACSISDATIPEIQKIIKARSKEQMESLFEAVNWVKNFADKSKNWGDFNSDDVGKNFKYREMMLKLMLSDADTTDKFKEGKSTVIKQNLLNNQEAFLNMLRENINLIPMLEKNKEVQRNIAVFEPGLSEKTFALFLEHKILSKINKDNNDISYTDAIKL